MVKEKGRDGPFRGRNKEKPRSHIILTRRGARIRIGVNRSRLT